MSTSWDGVKFACPFFGVHFNPNGIKKPSKGSRFTVSFFVFRRFFPHPTLICQCWSPVAIIYPRAWPTSCKNDERKDSIHKTQTHIANSIIIAIVFDTESPPINHYCTENGKLILLFRFCFQFGNTTIQFFNHSFHFQNSLFSCFQF